MTTQIQIKNSLLFYTFMVFVCLNSFFVINTAAQDNAASASENYIFETIDVPGVHFLAVTASSDFEDYAGYTKSADGEKEIAFTLIDGVFTTYDFPGSRNTYFFALGNNGNAAGHYEDSEGLHHGIVLADGELREYNFPDSVETEIYGISDSTGALTGNFIDAAGIRRGFSGDTIVEIPGASETFADFVNASEGIMVGSYIDADGLYHPYVRFWNGTFSSLDLPDAEKLEYYFVHGINDANTTVARSKVVDDVPRTYVGQFGVPQELRFPGSVSTEGWNINQDGSVVGHYDTADGRRHGFVAKPVADAEPVVAYPPVPTYTFESIDVPGVQFLALTASSDFEDYAGYTRGPDGEKMVGFTLIDSVFTTYDFPGSQNTYFYALGNNRLAAGHYEDSEGLHHGVILEDGKLRQYDFPGAIQTEIYGYSDATGVLTGNFLDAAGVWRGFSGDAIIEYPEASATFASFANSAGVVVGSYIDAEEKYHVYVRTPDGNFTSFTPPGEGVIEDVFITGINDAWTFVYLLKLVGDVQRTGAGSFSGGGWELRFPGAVSTEGWNINQEGSIVGHYDTADGRRHGFIARPVVDTPPQGDMQPEITVDSEYTFETIDVPGVQYLALTANDDFENYAGYTLSTDGKKLVGWTLIDGVFNTYDFPGSKNTYFYALGNNGIAAGYYEDSNGLYHGVILEDGELRQYDFPDAVQTFIHGYNDSTGSLTGNMIRADGVRRGFSGDTVIEFPDATATYANFTISDSGITVGSYTVADGTYHAYVLTSHDQFVPVNIPDLPNLEYFFFHDANDALAVVARAKTVGDVPRTYTGPFDALQELHFPGSVSTEGWNINQDGSVVGHYDTADGRRHGFIAKPPQDTPTPPPSEDLNYAFETIDVPGVHFLQLTASSDFEDYAGNTRSPDGEKIIGFTLIDGVFNTYDFPGSKNTYFYALGNNGIAAGHYEDSNGLYHGVILEDGELRQYDFPDAVQTFIHGYSDSTGVLTGSMIRADGVRRGFSGDIIIEFPDAPETYAEFVNAHGTIVGSYIDADGLFHTYMRLADGRFIDIPQVPQTEFYFIHGINDAWLTVGQAKHRDEDNSVTVVGRFQRDGYILSVPGSVRTEGWNINQDGSIVGNYESADGRIHGFIAKPTTEAKSTQFGNAYSVTLLKGLNMLSVPLAPLKSMTAKSLLALTGATTIITLDTATQHFVAWTPSAPDDGFPIEGGKSYIVNVPEVRNFAFVGAPWTDHTETAAAAPALSTDMPKEAWAFVVSGHLTGKPMFDGYQISVHNRRTNSVITAPVKDGYFAAATADLTQRSVVQVGDAIEVRVIGPDGNIESQTRSFKVTPEDLANAVLSVKLDSIGQPTQNQLLQNYPNPFNPETWIPYQLSEDSPVSVSIYDSTGKVVRTLSLGLQSAGFYNSRGRAAYWDGRNVVGEPVATGVYFYTLTAGDFSATRKMLIRK